MAKDKKKALLDNVDLSFEAAFELVEVKLKSMYWMLKMKVKAVMPETHRHYRAVMSFDEQPYLDQIASIESDVANGLFKDEPQSAKNAKKQISNIKADLEAKRAELEDIEFVASIVEMKYIVGGTQLVAQIPEECIEALNRQKRELGKAYKIRLEPVHI